MNEDFRSVVTVSRHRLITYARSELREMKTEPSSWVRTFMRGMLAGLKLAILESRFVHREIKRREQQGYTLVWLTPEELEILRQFNP